MKNRATLPVVINANDLEFSGQIRFSSPGTGLGRASGPLLPQTPQSHAHTRGHSFPASATAEATWASLSSAGSARSWRGRPGRLAGKRVAPSASAEARSLRETVHSPLSAPFPSLRETCPQSPFETDFLSIKVCKMVAHILMTWCPILLYTRIRGWTTYTCTPAPARHARLCRWTAVQREVAVNAGPSCMLGQPASQPIGFLFWPLVKMLYYLGVKKGIAFLCQDSFSR